LFSSSAPPNDTEMLNLFDPIITTEDNLLICAIPTKEEVVQGLSSLGSSKAPGPDGFIALFYKKYWSVVKEEVLGCIFNFFQNYFLLKELNHTHIAFVAPQILIVLFLIYLFDNIIQLISLRSLWYYGGW
jgi:hypothetical protein